MRDSPARADYTSREMSQCLKGVAVKDGGLILCEVRAIPKSSQFRLVLDRKPKQKSKQIIDSYGQMRDSPARADYTSLREFV